MFEGRDGRRGRHGRHRAEFAFEGGRGRSERPFEQGDLRWLILDLVAQEPRHGYEIIKAVEDLFLGRYAPSPGIVYPTLTFLEETGLIDGEAQGSKKLYRVTEAGRSSLTANAEAVAAVRARIEAFRARFGGPPAPEMLRAMDNLRAAIQVRWSKGDLSPESLAVITAALDRAAGEIERS
jgi:DNA-binding PadR family transcriptional regulator